MSAAERYPEHAKLGQVAPLSQAVGEFLDWASSQGVSLCRLMDSAFTFGEPRYAPVDFRPLIAEHFGIDEPRVEREKRSMLAGIRAGVPAEAFCECHHDCRSCSLSGDWHVHEPGECPVHPEAPVTGEG